MNQDPLGAQGRRVWSSTLPSSTSTDAIVVPCDPTTAGAHPAAAADRVLWSLEEIGEEGDTAKENGKGGAPVVVVVRLSSPEAAGAGGGGLCLAAAPADDTHTGGHGPGTYAAVVAEQEVGAAFLSSSLCADPFCASASPGAAHPALRATAAAAAATAAAAAADTFNANSNDNNNDAAAEERRPPWPFGEASGVRVEPCEAAGTPVPPRQQWVREGSLLKPAGSRGLCLAVASTNLDVRSVGVSVVLAPCNASYPWQQWTAPAPGPSSSDAVAAPATLVNGFQGQCLAPETDAPPGLQEAWAGPLADGGTAVLFFNREDAPVGVMSVPWSALGLDGGGAGGAGAGYEVRDLWAGAVLPPGGEVTGEGIRAWGIPAHGCRFFRVTPVGGG